MPLSTQPLLPPLAPFLYARIRFIILVVPGGKRLLVAYYCAYPIMRVRAEPGCLSGGSKVAVLLSFYLAIRVLIRQNYSPCGINLPSSAKRHFIMIMKLSLIEPIKQSVQHLSLFIVIIALAVGIGYYLWKSKTPPEQSSSISHHMALLFLGLFLFIAGVFPYLVSGHIPTLYEWTSRHQILVPIGASIIIYYLLSFLFSLVHLERWCGPLLLVLCCCFVRLNVSTYFDFQKDWLKQQSIISHFKSSDVIRNSSTLLFTDTTVSWNAIQRFYRFYEYTGLMKYAYHDDTRFGENLNTFQSSGIDYYLEARRSDRYNMRAYQPHKPQYLVTIVPGDLPLSTADTLRLLWQSAFDPQQFRVRILRVINFEFKQLD